MSEWRCLITGHLADTLVQAWTERRCSCQICRMYREMVPLRAEAERMREALTTIASLGYDSPKNTPSALVERSDFDTNMARWGLGKRDERPTI